MPYLLFLTFHMCDYTLSCGIYGMVIRMIEKTLVSEPDLAGISPLLTYKEAGQYLRKGANFVRDLVYAGELPIKRIGRSPYVHVRDLDAYIDRTTESGDDARRPEMTPAHRRKDSAA